MHTLVLPKHWNKPVKEPHASTADDASKGYNHRKTCRMEQAAAVQPKGGSGDFFLIAAVIASVAHYGGENGPRFKEGEQLPSFWLSHGKENPAPFPAAGGYAKELSLWQEESESSCEGKDFSRMGTATSLGVEKAGVHFRGGSAPSSAAASCELSWLPCL